MRAQGGRRRKLRAAVAAALTALALVLAPATLDGTLASFSATTVNAGDELATRQLQPPSGLNVTQSCTVTPTITHRAPTTGQGTTSVTLPVPGGTTAGDLLVAHIGYRNGTETITASSGWTLLDSTINGAQLTSAVYWKVATAGESSAVFSRPSNAPGAMGGALVAYIGVRTSDPVAVHGSAVGSGTTATTPPVITTATNVEVVHLLAKVRESLPAPSGTALMYQGTAGVGNGTLGLSGADETVTGPGTIASRSSTGSTSTEWIAQTLVLQRVRDIPSASLSWTASPSSWAGGYELTRVAGGSVQPAQPVTGVATTSATNGPLVNGTSYTFRLATSRGSWRSTPATIGLTPNC